MKQQPLNEEALQNGAAELAAKFGNGDGVKSLQHKSEKPMKTKPAQKTTVTAPGSAKPAALSLLDEILQAGDSFASGKVAEAISMANTILTNDKTVTAFVEAISAADALALQKLSFDRPEEEVQEEWYGLGLTELETQLQNWANSGDVAARKILAMLAAFRKSQVDVVGPLWQLVTEIVRPAMDVRSYYDLSQLLKNLVSKNLVEKLMNRRHYPEKAVVLGDERASAGYLPAMERGRVIPMAEAGWNFIKEAEARAKQRVGDQQERLTEMEGMATRLTPADAEKGVEGTIFLQIGQNSGALLQILTSGGHIVVRIAKSIGMRVRTPTTWISWDSRPDAWPDENVFRAFKAWKKIG